MSDRELLELAAKAAGITEFEYCEPNHEPALYVNPDSDDADFFMPLSDDGDALRLVVKLKLAVDVRTLCCTVEPIGAQDKIKGACEFFSDDESVRHAATRRAITRAAAEIGKAMP